MKIENLNHASLKITFKNGIRFLTDPWFEGHAFEGGWGLRFENAFAWEKARDCDYLWISHFHTDHFHVATLKKLQRITPEIKVICNESFNFGFSEAMRGLGFRNIIPFPERKRIQLADDLWITRFPTTGIDNMLLMESEGTTLLNYNDCNIPIAARKRLKRRIGRVDILFNNYNHAGKLMDHPLPEVQEIRRELKENFFHTIQSFEPRYTIPFASFHYYRAPESVDQNGSMMSVEDLVSLHDSVVPLNVGEILDLRDDLSGYDITPAARVVSNPLDRKRREAAFGPDELQEAYKKYYRKINTGFLYLTFWIPPLVVRVEDLDVTFIVKLSEKRLTPTTLPWHLQAHSSELHSWWDKRYGTDSFVVGGHFDLNGNATFPLRIKILFGLLTENKLDFRSMLRMVVSPSGIRFLWNRREEIQSLLFSGKLNFFTRK